MEFAHEAVMLNECIEALAILPKGIYLDGTAGGAGHSAAIAAALQGGTLYAFDQDPDAVAVARRKLAGTPAEVIHDNFRNAAVVLRAKGVERLDGALLDLGVSSYQLDDPQRGFTYREDAPLDMRMSKNGPDAAELVNGLNRQQLTDLLREYGEEPYAWQIAGRIEEARRLKPIETTGELFRLIVAALPAAVRRKDKNPARRTFQALRIAVNGELDALDESLDSIFDLLKPGGRFVVLTFHSLEDRLVKQRFRTWCTACTCPPEFPVCVCGGEAKAKPIGRKPRAASAEEVEQNRRSRSAKMRAIEKL